MKIRKDLPFSFDENYLLKVTEQAIIIEIDILSGVFIQQLRMPMVIDQDGGPEIVPCIQRCIAALILPFLKTGLLTDEFYEANKNILDETHGVRLDVKLDTMGVYGLAYDLKYMISRYMVVLGHDETLIPKQDEYYGDQRFFTPSSNPI